MVKFSTQIPNCGSHSPALLDLFLSSDTSIFSAMAFHLLGNSDHVVVSVSIDSPSNSQRDAPFHRVAYNHSCTELDRLSDHLRDAPWQGIFKLMLLLLLVEYVSGFRLELMYISLIVSIRSSLFYLHGFQLLVLLLQFIEITCFIFTNRINLLILK